MALLQAGYGEVDITPPKGAPLIGFGIRSGRCAEGLESPLRVRAVALDDGEARLLLVSCDLLGLSLEYSDQLRQDLAGEHSLGAEGVLLACTHTHYGPSVPYSCTWWDPPDPAYVEQLTRALREVALEAYADLQAADLLHRREVIEPLAYNRRLGGFAPIDPVLKLAVLRRTTGNIFLLNYACHAVALRGSNAISADWPGKAMGALEAAGQRAIFFQGFCGDLDPVNYANRGEDSEVGDLELLGEIVAARALKAARYARPSADVRLRSAETRLPLPLAVPWREDLDVERERWLDIYGRGDAGLGHWMEGWLRQARAWQAELQRRPVTLPAPIQAAAIGELRLLGLPAEVFCQYATRLEPWFPNLFSLGYCGGTFGYWPTREGFRDVPDDYAAAFSPLAHTLFPYQEGLEDLVHEASVKLLASLG